MKKLLIKTITFIPKVIIGIIVGIISVVLGVILMGYVKSKIGIRKVFGFLCCEEY